MASLPPADLRKLIGILGRLGSDFDGERAAAGLLATRLLRAAGTTWDDLLTAPKAQQPPPGGSQRGSQGGSQGWDAGRWQDSDNIAFCLGWIAELTAWEVQFVTDLRRKRRPLTPAQKAKIEQIVASLRMRGFT